MRRVELDVRQRPRLGRIRAPRRELAAILPNPNQEAEFSGNLALRIRPELLELGPLVR